MSAFTQAIDVHQQIRLTFSGRVTIAVLTVAGSGDEVPFGCGISICHPDDIYDKDLGADLAISRAYEDWGRDAQRVLNTGIDRRCKRRKEVAKLREQARERADEIKDMSAEEVLEATLERKPPKPSEKAPKERDPLEVLITGRELLQDPRRWIKGSLHKSVERRRTLGEPDADCPGVCAAGAIWVSAGGLDYDTGRELPALTQAYYDARRWLDHATRQQRPGFHASVTGFNDSDLTKHSDVLRVFDTAIAMAREAATGQA